MRNHAFTRRHASVAALATSLCLGGSGAALAQDSWDFNGFIYLWGSGLSGTTTTGQNIDMSFGDILDKLDFGLMGTVEANRGRWSVFGDAIYLKLAEGKNAAVGPGIPATADASMKGYIFTGAVGYDFLNTGDTRVNGFGGVRMLQLDATANLSIAGGSRRVSASNQNWDAVIGLRGRQTLSDRWTLAYYGDIGTGESDLTWQAAMSFDYRINNWNLSLGYRHMAWDISNSAVLSDLSVSGPFIGAKFSF